MSIVNLDYKLDLKTIALQARNAEYNPKVCSICLLVNVGIKFGCFFGNYVLIFLSGEELIIQCDTLFL